MRWTSDEWVAVTSVQIHVVASIVIITALSAAHLVVEFLNRQKRLKKLIKSEPPCPPCRHQIRRESWFPGTLSNCSPSGSSQKSKTLQTFNWEACLSQSLLMYFSNGRYSQLEVLRSFQIITREYEKRVNILTIFWAAESRQKTAELAWSMKTGIRLNFAFSRNFALSWFPCFSVPSTLTAPFFHLKLCYLFSDCHPTNAKDGSQTFSSSWRSSLH